MSKSDVYLTLRRMSDGRLVPHVAGCELVGCADVTINSNSQTKLVQLLFPAQMVIFDTATVENTEKLN